MKKKKKKCNPHARPHLHVCIGIQKKWWEMPKAHLQEDICHRATVEWKILNGLLKFFNSLFPDNIWKFNVKLVGNWKIHFQYISPSASHSYGLWAGYKIRLKRKGFIYFLCLTLYGRYVAVVVIVIRKYFCIYVFEKRCVFFFFFCCVSFLVTVS